MDKENMMPSVEKTIKKTSLSETIQILLRSKGDLDLSLGDSIDAIQDRGFGLLLMILALPSALPLPAAGYSTPFGMMISIIALQMIFLRKQPWLPRRARSVKIKASFAQKMATSTTYFMTRVERFIRPRLPQFCGRCGRIIVGFFVLMMAFLMILPIPLTNTFPAMVIFFFGMGLSEDDGLICLLGMGIGVVSIGLYTFVFYILFKYGIEGLIDLKNTIQNAIKTLF